MAEPLSQGKTIDSLPAPLRTKVLDMLIADVATRKIAQLMTEYGYKISHNAVAKYKRDDLQRHLETSRKLQKIQLTEAANDEKTQTLAEITSDVLAADPIMKRVEAKYGRYDRWFLDAEDSKDFTALASIDRAETNSLELHAKLTGRLQLTPANQTLVQVVITGKPEDVEGKALAAETAPSQIIDIVPGLG